MGGNRGILSVYILFFVFGISSGAFAERRTFTVMFQDPEGQFLSKPSDSLKQKVAKMTVKNMDYLEGKFVCADFAYAFRHVCGANGIECRQLWLNGKDDKDKDEGHVVNLIYEKSDNEGYWKISWVDPQNNRIAATWEIAYDYWNYIPSSAWDKVVAYYKGPEWNYKIVSSEGILDKNHACFGEEKILEVAKQFSEKTGIDMTTWRPVEREVASQRDH